MLPGGLREPRGRESQLLRPALSLLTCLMDFMLLPRFRFIRLSRLSTSF